MNKLLLVIVGLAFVSLSTVQAEGGCSGGSCKGKDKDKKEETQKDGKK